MLVCTTFFWGTRTSVHSEMSKAKNGHFQGFVQNKTEPCCLHYNKDVLYSVKSLSCVQVFSGADNSRLFVCLGDYFAFLPFLSFLLLPFQMSPLSLFGTSKVLVFESFPKIILFSLKPTFWKACEFVCENETVKYLLADL